MVTPSVDVPLADSDARETGPLLVALSVPPFSTTAMLPLLLIAPVSADVPPRVSVPLPLPKSTAPSSLALSARERFALPTPKSTLPVRLDAPDRAMLSLPAPSVRLPVMLPAETVSPSLPDPSRISPIMVGAAAVEDASACVRVTPLLLAVRSMAVLVRPPDALIRPVLDRLASVPEESSMAIAVPFSLLAADALTVPLMVSALADAPASMTMARADVPASADPAAPTVPPTLIVPVLAPDPSRNAVALLS